MGRFSNGDPNNRRARNLGPRPKPKTPRFPILGGLDKKPDRNSMLGKKKPSSGSGTRGTLQTNLHFNGPDHRPLKSPHASKLLIPGPGALRKLPVLAEKGLQPGPRRVRRPFTKGPQGGPRFQKTGTRGKTGKRGGGIGWKKRSGKRKEKGKIGG